MAKRRTRKDKLSAKHTYQLRPWDSFQETPAPQQTTSDLVLSGTNKRGVPLTAEALYGYDSWLIVSDLVRTVLIALVVLVAELGLYYWWR